MTNTIMCWLYKGERLMTHDDVSARYAKFNQDRIFSYLNDLRDSGVTNMFGASKYIEREFNMSRSESTKVLVKWMENYRG